MKQSSKVPQKQFQATSYPEEYNDQRIQQQNAPYQQQVNQRNPSKQQYGPLLSSSSHKSLTSFESPTLLQGQGQYDSQMKQQQINLSSISNINDKQETSYRIRGDWHEEDKQENTHVIESERLHQRDMQHHYDRMREGGRVNRAQSDINQYMQHFLTTSSNKDDIANTGGDEQLMSVDRRNIIRVTSDGDSNTGGLYQLSQSQQKNPYVLNTNKTNSSQKNVPMSYSSTGSKGHLQSRFQQLHAMSPSSMNEPYEINSAQSNEQRNMDFNMQSNSNYKKTVRFDEQSDSKIKINDENVTYLSISGADERQMPSQAIHKHFQYGNSDNSQIIQQKITTQMNDINRKYFNNEYQQQQNQMNKDKPNKRIQILEQSEDKDDYNGELLSDDEVQDQDNSLVVLEEEIEQQRKNVYGKLEQKYFSITVDQQDNDNKHNQSKNEYGLSQLKMNKNNYQSNGNLSSIINGREMQNSFDKLRDEILNKSHTSQYNTIEKQQQMNYDQNVPQRTYNPRQGQSNTNNQQQVQTVFNNQKDSTDELLQNYESLRNKNRSSQSRSQRESLSSIVRDDVEKKYEMRGVGGDRAGFASQQLSYREYVDKLKNEHQQFESKLQNLKSKIYNIQTSNDGTSNVQQTNQNRTEQQNDLYSPTMKDLEQRKDQYIKINDDATHNRAMSNEQMIDTNINILQPNQENTYQTISSRGNSKSPQSSHKKIGEQQNTKDLKQKIHELRQSITESSAEDDNYNIVPLQINVMDDRVNSNLRQNSNRGERTASLRGPKQNNSSDRARVVATQSSLNRNNRVDLKKGLVTRSNNNIPFYQQKKMSEENERNSIQAYSTLETKIKWLDQRNKEQSYRIRDLVSEKRESEQHINKLQQNLKDVQKNISAQGQSNKTIQKEESRRIEDLQFQIHELKRVIKEQNQQYRQQQHIQSRDKENIMPPHQNQNQNNFMTIGSCSVQEYNPFEHGNQANQTNNVARTISAKKAPLIPLRQNSHRAMNKHSLKQDKSTNKSKRVMSLSVDRSNSRSKSKQKGSKKDLSIIRSQKQDISQGEIATKKRKKSKSLKILKKRSSKSKSQEKKSNNLSAIITQLSSQVSQLSGQVQVLTQDKQSLQDKIGKLSNFYFGALKELKNNFISFKEDSLQNQQQVFEDVSTQLKNLLVKTSTIKKSNSQNILKEDEASKENRFKRVAGKADKDDQQ